MEGRRMESFPLAQQWDLASLKRGHFQRRKQFITDERREKSQEKNGRKRLKLKDIFNERGSMTSNLGNKEELSMHNTFFC